MSQFWIVLPQRGVARLQLEAVTSGHLMTPKSSRAVSQRLSHGFRLIRQCSCFCPWVWGYSKNNLVDPTAIIHEAISNDFWPPKLMKGDVEHKPILVTWQRWSQSRDVTDVFSHTIIRFAAQILVLKNRQWFYSSHRAHLMCPDSLKSSEWWNIDIVSFLGSKPQLSRGLVIKSRKP